MYNATNSAPHRPSLHRLNSLLSLSLLSTAQLNDLFVNLLSRLGSTRRNSSCLIAPQFNATICLFLFASRHGATLRGSVRRSAALRNATQRFVCYNASPRGSAFHRAARLPAAHRASTQLNDLFVTPRRNVAYSIAALFYSTQRFVYQFIAAPRNVPPCSTALRLSTQLNDLFVNLLSRLDTALGNEPRRNSPCRDAQQLNSTICLSIYYYNAPFCIAPPRSAPRLNAPQFNSTN